MWAGAWLFVGLVAILATGVAIFTDDDAVAIMFGVAGFVTWGVWTFGTLEISVVGGGDAPEMYQMPALTFLGVALALLPGYIALTGPIEVISRHRDTRMEDI